MPAQLLRLTEVTRMAGLCRSAIYDRMSRGEFPRPVSVGRRAVRWNLADVEAWVQSRPVAGANHEE